MPTSWTPRRVEATEAGDVVVTTNPSEIASLFLESMDVNVTLKDGEIQVIPTVLGGFDSDYLATPIVLSKGITLNFTGPGVAFIKYREASWLGLL